MNEAFIFSDEDERSPLALPMRVLLRDQYRIGRVLGVGGFGITYLAVDQFLDTVVAIKEYLPRDIASRSTDGMSIHPHSSQSSQDFQFGLDQFLQEARTLAQFDHPNIVRVLSFFEAHATGYLVMDYYKGRTLDTYLDEQGGTISEHRAKRIILPALDGLRAVHDAGILHRDIDPKNLYLADNGSVVLLDFGAARVAMGERSKSLSVILKPGFAPYEQYHSRGHQGPWTDIYACAATLYRCITGRIPPEAVGRAVDDELVKPEEFRGLDVSPEMSNALLKGLSVHPKDRPQSVEAFEALLEGREPPPDAASGWAPPASESASAQDSSAGGEPAAPPTTTQAPEAPAADAAAKDEGGPVAAADRNDAPVPPRATERAAGRRPVAWGLGILGGIAVLVMGLWSVGGWHSVPLFSPNQPPSVVPDGATTITGEDTVLDVLANDTDPDGDSLRIASIGTAASGVVTRAGSGALRYTPAPDFVGEDSFQYTVSDEQGNATPATVTVTVEDAPNAAPTVVDDEAQTQEGRPVDVPVLANDEDPDGDSLRVDSVGTPSNGRVEITSDGHLRYRPRSASADGDTFAYRVTDGEGHTAEASVRISVSARSAQSYVEQGKQAFNRGQYQRAVQALSTAIERGANNDESRLYRGVAYQMTGNYQASLAEFNLLIERNPETAMHYSNRGYSYLAQEQYNKAIQDFRSAVGKSSSVPDAYAGLALAYRGLNNSALATSYYQEAVAQEPRFGQSIQAIEEGGYVYRPEDHDDLRALIRAVQE